MDDVSPKGTRERILEAAELLFADRGYAGTRLHEIAREVGVQKASLFHHFASKEDLYRAVLDEGHQQSQLALQKALAGGGPPLASIRALTEAYIDMVVARPERTKILLRESLGDAPPGPPPHDSQRILGAVVDFVSDWQRQMGNPEVDTRALLVGVVGMVAFFFTSAPVLAPDWFSDPLDPDSVARVKRLVAKIVEDGLAASLDVNARAQTKVAAV
jgi:AcrR family transcriptional regulator